MSFCAGNVRKRLAGLGKDSLKNVLLYWECEEEIGWTKKRLLDECALVLGMCGGDRLDEEKTA